MEATLRAGSAADATEPDSTVRAARDVPRHVAIVMDGSARWAAQRGLSRLDGRVASIAAALETIRSALSAGARYLTLYAFSGSSTARGRDERNTELHLLCDLAAAEQENFRRHGIRVNVISPIDDLPTAARSALERLAQHTSAGTRLELNIALSQCGRQDIVDAARWLATRVRAGLVLPEEIDEAIFREHLNTRDLPAVDVLIRTGEPRSSDCLLFDAADAELVLLDTLWPDFGAEHFERAIERYASRVVRARGGYVAAPVGPSSMQPVT